LIYIKNLKLNINGAVNNLNIEELCKTIPLLDKNINVEIYNINSDYKNSKNEIEHRNQNIL